ncbi:hypothetical protein CJ739_627 [Mariniflexile rhizosphaerae]|nr:hypothetical protein CJ739_627 [Mariniflexile sp. TRM1-10]
MKSSSSLVFQDENINDDQIGYKKSVKGLKFKSIV